MPLLVFGCVARQSTERSGKRLGARYCLASACCFWHRLMKAASPAFDGLLALDAFAVCRAGRGAAYALIGLVATHVSLRQHAVNDDHPGGLASGQLAYGNALAMGVGATWAPPVYRTAGSAGAAICGRRLGCRAHLFKLVTALVALAICGGLTHGDGWPRLLAWLQTPTALSWRCFTPCFTC